MATFQSAYTGLEIEEKLDNSNQDTKTTASPTFVAQTLSGLLVYADEAAAVTGGILVTGNVYQTATGELRIKL
jgi:hypothetical protein